MNVDRNRILQSSESEKTEAIREELTLPGLHEDLIERIIGLPSIRFDTRVLDLGCGSGAWLARLADRGFENLTGIDNESFVRFQPHAKIPIAFHHANLDCDIGMGSERFGLITAIEVIEHLLNPGLLLENVAKHLEPDGLFLLTTPNVHSLRARLRFAFSGKLAGFDPTNVPAEPTHVFPVFVTCLERMLSRYGLTIRSQWTFPAGSGNGTRLTRRFATALTAFFLKNDLPGDSICILCEWRTESAR